VQRTAEDLLGRDDELGAVRAMLRQGPLVTLTGVGGVGKTRLAQAVLALEADRRAAVCELGSVVEPAAVAFAVADALGFPSLDAAFAGLGGDEVVLVVDNCEHVLDAAAETVARLIGRCPGVTVLATSREALGVPAEHVLALAPLALPATDADAAGSPAVQLLLARAAAGGASVDLASDPAAVVALCRRLDGLPLAIELAAARLRSLTPREVLGYLDRRLGLLRRSQDRGPGRHRSLEAAIEWSYERLPDPTRAFFECLSVFSGRFTAQQAHEVAGGDDLLDTLERLDLLVAQSLVTVDQQQGRTWYGLLQILRDYARERLVERGDLHRVRDRWIDSLVSTANDARARFMHAWPVDLVITLQNTHGDVADALRWCVANDETPDRALPLFVPLCALLKRRSAMPIAELGDLVLQRWPQARHDRWAEAAAAASLAHVLRGSGERGAVLARQAINGRSSSLAEVNARRALFFHAHMAGRDDDGLRWVEEAIELAAAHDMGPWVNELLTFRAIALASLGRVEEAIEQVSEAYRTAPAMGSPALEAWAAAVQASLVALRDPVAGRAMCEQAARHCEEVDYPIGAALSLRTLGALAMLAGQHADAAGFLLRALDASVGIGYSSETALTLRWAARLAHLSGRSRASATLWSSAGRTRGDVVDALLDRSDVDTDLVAAEAPALAQADAVAMARTELAAIAEASPSREPGRDRGANLLRLEGAVWEVVFDGATVRLPDIKGMRDLAVLLARPGREVHCTELMGAAVEQSDTGPVLDGQARRAYEAKIVELQGELAEAEDFGDAGRAEKLRMDMELLLAELAAATGFGGRTRHTGASTDRVRSAVSQRIRAALRRLEELHPPLGRHLRTSVHTGTWCAYRPEPPVRWEL
jgi:predicted ATPase